MKSLSYKCFFCWCGRSKVQSLTPRGYLQKEAMRRQKERVTLPLFLGSHLLWLTESKNRCRNLESRTFTAQSSGRKAESLPGPGDIRTTESMPGGAGKLVCVTAEGCTARLGRKIMHNPRLPRLCLFSLALRQQETGFAGSSFTSNL